MKLERSFAEEVELEGFLGEVSAHLIRVLNLANLAQNTYSDHLSHVELHDNNARETADQLDTLIEVATSEISATISRLDASFSALIEPQSSVGKHVDIQRKRAYTEALEAFRAANSVPIPDCLDLAGFEKIAGAASDALLKFVATCSPDPGSFIEKMSIVRQEGAIHTDGVIDGLFADVEYLARRYEIASDDAPAPDRPDPRANWEIAVAHYHTISAAEKVHPMSSAAPTDPDYDKVSADHALLLTSLFQAFDRVVQMPAPDYLAVAEKLDAAMDMRGEHDHVLEGVKFAAADIRRLCGEA